MNILVSELYKEQLEALLETFENHTKEMMDFKLYLDTIILNMPTKVKKFKKSIYFDDENIKDIEHKGLVIPFLIDEANKNYVILGIMEKEIDTHAKES